MIPLSLSQRIENPRETRRNRVILSFLRCGLVGQVEAKGEAWLQPVRRVCGVPPVPLRITIVFPSRCCSRACVDANGRAPSCASCRGNSPSLFSSRSRGPLFSFSSEKTLSSILETYLTLSPLLQNSKQFRVAWTTRLSEKKN